MDRINDYSYDICKNGIFTLLPSAIREYFIRINPNTKKIFAKADYIYEKTDLAAIQRPAIFVKILSFNPKGTDASWGEIDLEMRLDLPTQTMRQERSLATLQIMNVLSNIAFNNWGTDPNSLLGYCQIICGGKTGISWLWKLVMKNLDFKKMYDEKDPRFYAKIEFQVSQQSYNKWINEGGYTLTNPDTQVYKPVTGLKKAIILKNNKFKQEIK
jgi:hypothetical protein